MSDGLQQVVVLAIVLIAFAFLVRRLTGWPRLRAKKPKAQSAVLGDRLARGLEKAKDRAKE